MPLTEKLATPPEMGVVNRIKGLQWQTALFAPAVLKGDFPRLANLELATTALAVGGGAETDLRLAHFAMTDLGNAERFAARYSGRLAWSRGSYWSYRDGGTWRPDVGGLRVRRATHDVARAIQDEARALAAEDEAAAATLAKWGRTSESNGGLTAMALLARPYLEVDRGQR